MDRNRKILSGILLLTTVTLSGVASIAKTQQHSTTVYNADIGADNYLEMSSQNPVFDSQIKTNKGTNLWVKGDSSSGVTWNNGSGKVAIAKHGYIQTLTTIHGINKVTVNLASGSVDLFHDFKEPNDLNTPMYGVDYTFSKSSTYEFTGTLPNRIRIKATEDSIINSIIVAFDCKSAEEDPNSETIDDGFENSYIDAGTIGKYGNTTYVTGSDNVSSTYSKRALKVDFKGTTNNYISLNLDKTSQKYIDDEAIDLRNSILKLKAKFSADISDYGMKVCPIGSSWENVGYLDMNRSVGHENGWYTYSIDFSSLSYTGNNDVIRLNVKPTGIDETNKSTASVIFDDITYAPAYDNRTNLGESYYDGLENLPRDTGWENTTVSFSTAITYGRTSKSSLVAKPKKGSKNAYRKWYIALNLETADVFTDMGEADFTKGLLSFQYKPVNVTDPSSIYLSVFKDWDTEYRKTITTTALRDGWYQFSYSLANLGIPEGSGIIRVLIGFDSNDETVDGTKVYFDNIKIRKNITEDYTQGWENMPRDTGWEKCNAVVDNAIVASETSSSSLKLTFSGKAIDMNKNFVCLSTQAAGIHAGLMGNTGILEGKFLFNKAFTDRSIRLVLVDSGWSAARYDLPVTPIGDGWYQFRQNLANLPEPSQKDSAYNATDLIRVGFGFNGITSSNKDTAVVWMDEVYYSNNSSISTITDATIWQAYDTENVLLTDSPTSGRIVSEEKPLEFSDLKNGTDATQLMIKANSNISSYSFAPGTLYSASGDTLRPENFEVLVEKYFYVPSNSSEKYGSSYGWRGAGYYPDALVPIDRIIKASENIITSGNEQGLWINCKIPADQASGLYEGSGVLTLNGTKYNVPMKVKVYNAYLSDENHAKTQFLIWDDQTQIGEGKDRTDNQMHTAYYEFLANRRISTGSMRGWNIQSHADFAETFAKYIANDERISAYRIPSEDTYDDMYAYCDALIDKNIEVWDEGNHVSFFDKAIFYIHDEPNQPEKNPSSTAGQASIEQWADVKQTQTDFKNVKSALASKLNDYPVIQASFLDMRNVLPYNCDYNTISGGTYYNPTKKNYPNYFNDDYIDTPCPTFDHLNVESERNAYLNTFDHVWFYGCILPNLPYPSFHADTRLLGQRLISWMQYRYGFEGQIYFCVNYNLTDEGEGGVRDVWNNIMTDGKGAGDGALVYPGERYNVYGPISSMRLENIRSSYEDYEYFYMIEQRLARYNALNGTAYTSSTQLFTGAEYTSMFTGTTLNASFMSETFEAYRNRMLLAIESIYR